VIGSWREEAPEAPPLEEPELEPEDPPEPVWAASLVAKLLIVEAVWAKEAIPFPIELVVVHLLVAGIE